MTRRISVILMATVIVWGSVTGVPAEEMSVKGYDRMAHQMGLISAIRQGRVDVVKHLLNTGETITKNGQGAVIPLLCAVEKGNSEILGRLLAAGFDVNARTADAHETPLLKAAALGRLEMAKVLVDHGADVNAADRYGNTALMSAAWHGAEMTTLLLDHGAEVNSGGKSGWIALVNAAKKNHLDVVRLLLSRGADATAKTEDGRTVLMMAAAKGNRAMVELLLESGADPGARTKCKCRTLTAWYRGDERETLRPVLPEAKPRPFQMCESTTLMAAARGGNPDVVKLLLDKGADVNAKTAKGYTALMAAAKEGKPDVVKLLLERGADPAAQTTKGYTALMAAGKGGNPETEKLLLDRGLDIHAKTRKGDTALRKAVKKGNREAAEFLLERGADPLKTHEGRTLLMDAANPDGGDPALAKLLIEKGVDVNAKAHDGWTALLLAAMYGHREMVMVLIENGADVNQRKRLHLGPFTVLQWAVAAGDAELVRILLEHGADANIQDPWIAVPSLLSVAEEKGDKEIIRLLKAHGAREKTTAETKQDLRRKAVVEWVINGLGVKTYRPFARGDKNVAFSPFALYYAIAMICEGAGDDTRREIERILGIDIANAVFPATLEELTRLVAGELAPAFEELSVANSFWVQQSCRLREPFRKTIADRYHAEVRYSDFSGNPGKAVREVNDWIEERNRNTIPHLLDKKKVMIWSAAIVNTASFRSPWAQPFHRESTRPASFIMLDGSTASVPMMQRLGQRWQYLETPQFQALALPFEGHDLAMVIFLPRQAGGLAQFERRLRLKSLNEWVSRLFKPTSLAEVAVYIPRFEAESQLDLVMPLAFLGMGHVFSDQTDPSRMAEGRPRGRFICDVIQNARLKVNEHGSEAAAATASSESTGMAPRQAKLFRANHSFMYLIYHIKSECILFIGRVTRPVSGTEPVPLSTKQGPVKVRYIYGH